MNIAIVYPSLRAVGGAENVIIWLAEGLSRKHRVVLFTGEFSEATWGHIKERPYGVHILDFTKHRSTLRTNREAGAMLAAALSSYRFDVVHPHNYPASLWVYYAKQQTGAFPKTVLFLHNLTRTFYESVIDVHLKKLPGVRNVWNRYRPKKLFRALRQALFGYRKLDQAAVRDCDIVLANSSYTAELAGRIYRREVQTCTLGVSVERFLPQQDASTKPVGNNGVTLLTVTRIELQKNLDTLLSALKILKDQNRMPKGLLYKIAGNGPYLAYHKKKVQRMGLDGFVQLLGHVPPTELGKLYAEARFLVHIPLDEPFGLVPLEAALFKKPSIVSDHAGPAITVLNGITGIHVDALDPQKIAEAIAELLGQPEKVTRMGEAAFSWVCENMTWNIFLDKLENTLQKTVLASKLAH
jgi:glycosyltransferase involved in cell wall biosynthesis